MAFDAAAWWMRAELNRSICSCRMAAVALYALRHFRFARLRLRCDATEPWMSFVPAVFPLILKARAVGCGFLLVAYHG